MSASFYAILKRERKTTKTKTYLMNIQGFAPIAPIKDAANPTQGAGAGFSELVQNAARGVVSDQKEAAALSKALANGDNIPIQDVIAAVGKAELTLQTMVTVRDRAVEAYQEILRMPI